MYTIAYSELRFSRSICICSVVPFRTFIKSILPPLIPDCFALRASTIFKNIHKFAHFSMKNGYLFIFLAGSKVQIFLQASLHQILNILTLVSWILCGKMDGLYINPLTNKALQYTIHAYKRKQK